MILGLLLRSPFWTNALYAIALVSLTMQDTPGKFDITAVYCVCMEKRHRNVCDFQFIPFRMTCYTFLRKGLIHQALSLYAIEVPLNVSIASLHYCSADVDIIAYKKGAYLMRGIAAIMVKATSCIFFPSGWRAMLDQSLQHLLQGWSLSTPCLLPLSIVIDWYYVALTVSATIMNNNWNKYKAFIHAS